MNQFEWGRYYGTEMSNNGDLVGTFGPEVKVRRRPMTKHPNGTLGRYIWDPEGDTGRGFILKPLPSAQSVLLISSAEPVSHPLSS